MCVVYMHVEKVYDIYSARCVYYSPVRVFEYLICAHCLATIAINVTFINFNLIAFKAPCLRDSQLTIYCSWPRNKVKAVLYRFKLFSEKNRQYLSHEDTHIKLQKSAIQHVSLAQ
jgi:hypothetical protein